MVVVCVCVWGGGGGGDENGKIEGLRNSDAHCMANIAGQGLNVRICDLV